MYECQIDGVQGDTTGGHDYICDSDASTTKQCVSGEEKYGLQISIPLDNTRNINDICVGNLWVDDNFIYVEGNENFIGDSGNNEFLNYRYFDLDTGTEYLPSQASGAIVPGLPRCVLYHFFIFVLC